MMSDHLATILLVEDNPGNLKLLTIILENRGYRVLLVPSGEHALEALQLSIPDLVLLDVRLPGIDGYEVCKKIKATPSTAQLPVLFISALNKPEDVIRGFEAGGIDFVTKPIQEAEVLARIDTHIQLYQSRLQLAEKSAKLEQANRQVNEALEAKSSFLASMSHELRTPLAVILGNVELLQDECSACDKEKNNVINTIEVASRNQLALVNDILDLSKIEAGKFEIDEEPYGDL
jgi:DNA-binding response OmpR family regulator